MNDKKFRPVMGYDENIKDVAKNPIKNGYVYFATDTGIIYLDANGKRTVMSSSDGASSGIFYANRKIEKEEKDLKYIEVMHVDLLEPAIHQLNHYVYLL